MKKPAVPGPSRGENEGGLGGAGGVWARAMGWWVGGLACLILALVATGLLSAKHMLGFSLPGCGPGSGCGAIGSSPWGKVPGLGWPVAYVGFSYFLAAAVGWVAFLRAPQRAVVWVALAAGGVSVLYIGVALTVGPMCGYCLTANAANVAFSGLAAATASGASAPGRKSGGKFSRGGWAVPAGLLVFVLSTGALAVVDQQARAAAARQADRERAESVTKMTGKATQDEPGTAARTTTTASGGQVVKPEVPGTASTSSTPTTPDSGPAAAPFTGRWRLGPAAAPVRVVMFVGYQCPDCRLLEAEARQVLASEPRMSLSVKQFPMCVDCNPRIGRNMHPNGCWAARAAEAAGILHGEEGFWKMHDWLFGRGGAFTDAELDAGLSQLGFERAGFLRVMQSPETLARVKADIAEGWELGLFFTPMIFVNGIELKGWQAPQAITKTVREVLAANPPARGAESDQPARAQEKYIADWRESAQRAIVMDPKRPGGVGPADAPVRVVIWGDLQEPGTCEADRYMREMVKTRSDVRYEYRHYVINRACNPAAPRDLFPQGCLAARAVEAAGHLGGGEGYERMREWLVNNRERLSEQALRDGIPALQLESADMALALEVPEIKERIAADGRAGQALGLQSIPAIYVNGRQVPRWKMAGENTVVLPRIVDEAAGKGK